MPKEPPRPYYIKKSRPILTQILSAVFTPLFVDEHGVATDHKKAPPTPKSKASKMTIDQ
jgi:hypothetical protein